MPPLVTYGSFREFPGWEQAPCYLTSLIQRFGARRVLEIGSGANPTLDVPTLAALGIRYITSDVNARELAKAPRAFEARVLNAERGPIPSDLIRSQDLVFSRMVNEHICEGRAYHANVRELLAPGGVAVHCFASLFALPFLVNVVTPSWLSLRLVRMSGPRDEYQHAKFPAYYSWSRGPSRRMIRRFTSLGYRVLEYHGYFGHNYYGPRLPVLDRLERVKTRLLVARPIPALCAYGVVVLQRADA